jgi:4-hydroxy-tetrahydrodipicolinate reductase
MLPEYDVEIFEMHHNQKVDSPSGTALKLADQVARALGRDPREAVVPGRSGTGKRKDGEIGIASLRGGDVVGDHIVIFAGTGERVELAHRAQSRDAFASGVVSSIRFVSKAEPGIYSLKDVIRASMGD